MKKLVVKKGIQSRVSAKSVPSWVPPQFLAGQDFLSNSTQCTQKNRKTFLKGKVKEGWIVNHPFSQSKRIGKTWVPSVPMPTTPGKTRLCGGTHISTQHKKPSAVHRSWMLKSILDGISPMLTHDKRRIWWAPFSNAVTDRRNGNSPQFTGLSQSPLFFWPIKQLNGFESGVLIENLDFEYMRMWANVKGKSKTLALPRHQSGRHDKENKIIIRSNRNRPANQPDSY